MAKGEIRSDHLDTLDHDLGRYSNIELATQYAGRPLVGYGFALAFLLLAGVAALTFSTPGSHAMTLGAAAVFAGYLALNIGANDVANNMGPAVGARVLTMGGAIAIAAVFESAGALIAGGDVVDTVAGGIIPPGAIADPRIFVRVMMAALLSAAIWVNIATRAGAPVSTTHAIVGSIAGAGIAAAGWGAVAWETMLSITLGWVVSPLLGGMIAAAVLWVIKARIIYREDKIAAARTWVPVLVGVMGGAFACYLALKGLNRLAVVGFAPALSLGCAAGMALWIGTIPVIRKQSEGLENRDKSLKRLFGLPLIVAAALLSFAHGANDVANAVGPLAAILKATTTGLTGGIAVVPAWDMFIGAFGISLGLILFGPRLIRMVGSRITRLNPMRAYCVALSAAVTVILASGLGIPVSTTHVAVGAIFGVGFFREWYEARRLRRSSASVANRPPLAVEERRRRKLVRRSHFLTIMAAWIVTVPAAGVLSGLVFMAMGLAGD
ncbi:inorganic phosphate transporter [Sulfitobacter sp. LCG007]